MALMSGERLIYRTRKSLHIFDSSVAAAALPLWWTLHDLFTAGPGFMLEGDKWIAYGLCFIPFLYFFLKALPDYLWSELYLTDVRVVGFGKRINALFIDDSNLRLDRLESVTINWGYFGNYGTVTVHGTGGGGLEFDYIYDPATFQHLVSEEIERYMGRYQNGGRNETRRRPDYDYEPRYDDRYDDGRGGDRDLDRGRGRYGDDRYADGRRGDRDLDRGRGRYDDRYDDDRYGGGRGDRDSDRGRGRYDDDRYGGGRRDDRGR